MEKMICSVFKSQKKEGMYVYILKAQGFSSLPEALRNLFGVEKLAMTLVLTEEKKLARLPAKEVMQAIRDKGFYLQMPPQEDNDMQALAEKNSLLSRG